MNHVREQYYTYLFNETLLINKNLAKNIFKKYHKYFNKKIKFYLKI